MLPAFNLFDQDFLSDLSDLIEQHFGETEEEKEETSVDTPCSYYHFVSDKYEDGQNVSHKEKIVRDGKVVKDVETCNSIEDKKKKEEEGEEVNDPNAEINAKNKEIEELNNFTKSLRNEIDTLVKENENLTNENKMLREKLDLIKGIF